MTNGLMNRYQLNTIEYIIINHYELIMWKSEHFADFYVILKLFKSYYNE